MKLCLNQKNLTLFERRHFKWVFIFLVPMLIYFSLFIFWPIFGTIYYSFFQWDGLRGEWPSYFIGLRNYRELFKDEYFYKSMLNTMLFVIGQNVIKIPLSLILAYLINNLLKRGKSFYKTVIFLPLLTSTSVMGIIFTFILSTWHGPLNNLLVDLGLNEIDFLGNEQLALVTITIVSIWGILGQYLIYWLAALQSVPAEIYEAAELDGCTATQKLFFVTLPMIKPIAVIITFLGIIYSLRLFDIVMTTTGGGPVYATEVLATYIYKTAFVTASPRIGYASSVAVSFMVIMVTVGLVRNLFKDNDN